MDLLVYKWLAATSLAAASALTLPWIPMWVGIQCRVILPTAVWNEVARWWISVARLILSEGSGWPSVWSVFVSVASTS